MKVVDQKKIESVGDLMRAFEICIIKYFVFDQEDFSKKKLTEEDVKTECTPVLYLIKFRQS